MAATDTGNRGVDLTDSPLVNERDFMEENELLRPKDRRFYAGMLPFVIDSLYGFSTAWMLPAGRGWGSKDAGGALNSPDRVLGEIADYSHTRRVCFEHPPLRRLVLG